MAVAVGFVLVAGLGWWLLGRGAPLVPPEPGGGAESALVRATPSPGSDPGKTPAGLRESRPGTPLEADPAGGPDRQSAADDPLDPSARSTLEVSGRVVDENARPVAGAEVRVVVARAASPPSLTSLEAPALPLALDDGARTLTESDGSFKLLAVREPALTGDATKTDASAATTTDAAGTTTTEASGTTSVESLLLVRRAGLAIAVLPCQPTDRRASRFDAGTLVMSPGSDARLRVLDENGAPVEGAVLQLPLAESRPFDPVAGRRALERRALLGTSDAEGRVRIDGFPAGAAELECLHRDFVPVTLAAIFMSGRTTDLGDLLLQRGDAISGAVTDRDGRPLAGAAVLLRVAELTGCAPDDDPVLSNLLIRSFVRGSHDVRTQTDERGRFHAGTLNHPSYAVFADAPGYEPVCADGVLAGTTDLQIVLEREALVVLSIVDRDTGLPLSDAHATAQRCRPATDGTTLNLGPYLPVLTGPAAAKAAANSANSGNSGSAGSAGNTRDGDGAGLIVVERPGAEGTSVTVRAAGHATAHVVLPGVAPPDRYAQTLALDRELEVRGRVIETSGQPIAGARVLLVPPDSGAAAQRAPRSAVTDAVGSFRVTGLFDGAWSAMASAGGWVDSPAQRVELDALRATAPLVFQMQRGGYLAGTVRSASGGTAAPGLRVRIVAPSGKPVSVPVGSSFGSDTASSIGVDAEGRWTCTRALAPGEYRVSLIRPASAGGAAAEQVLSTTTVQLVAGKTLSVPLTIDA